MTIRELTDLLLSANRSARSLGMNRTMTLLELAEILGWQEDEIKDTEADSATIDSLIAGEFQINGRAWMGD